MSVTGKTPSPKEVLEGIGSVKTARSIFNPKSLSLFGGAILLMVGLIFSSQLVETNDAGYTAVLQRAFTGNITVHTKPGMFVQLGDVTFYKKADVFYFSKHDGEGVDDINEAIPVRFNDGATANVNGNIRFELPSYDKTAMENLHHKFRSFDNVTIQTVKQAVREAVILTAALMTAEESYTVKRALFAEMARDQVENGVYFTEAEIITTVDTEGQKTKKAIPVIKLYKASDKDLGKHLVGSPRRRTPILKQYGIHTAQFVINEFDYEIKVQELIKKKRQALQETITAKAEAEKAVQDRLTEIEKGKMRVAKAEYEKKEEKIRAVVTAEKELEVARFAKLAAAQTKQKEILLGQGEATRKRLVMQADGALKTKANIVLEINKVWADAFSKFQGNVVPLIGGNSGGKGGGINAFQTAMQAYTLQAVKQLNTDLKVPKGTNGK